MNSIVSVASIASATAIEPSSIVAKVSSDDVELITLGAQLDSVEAEWVALRAESDREMAAFEKKVFAATGTAFRDAPPLTDENREKGYWATRSELVHTTPHPDPDLLRWGANSDRLFSFDSHSME